MGLWKDQASEARGPSEASLWKSQPNGDKTNTGSKPTIRRLSSATANFDKLRLGPSVVVPPKHMEEPSDAHETAAALELAKHRLSEVGSEDTSTPPTRLETTTTDSYAFAFDIDGVLIRGGRPIPEAIEAMKVLNGQNEYGIKV